MKENQVLKYLNKGSQHTKSCFRAIPLGVFKRLSKLTTITNANRHKTINEIYPDHAAALRTAGLVIDFPTLNELSKEEESINNTAISKVETEKSRSRQTYFCIGVSNGWSDPIHALLKKNYKASMN